MILAILTLFLSQSTSAQTLQDTMNRAEADYREADQNFKVQIGDSGKYVPCDAVKSGFYRTYADWYRKNATEIFKLYGEVESLFTYTNTKIQQLQQTTISALAESGQTENQNVTFQKLAAYISDLNLKAQSAKRNNQYNAFKLTLSDPMYSPFNLSLEQAIATIQKLTQLMNASLRERGVTFKVEFAEADAHFDLRLNVKFDNYPTPAYLDLLSGAQTLDFTPAQKWRVLGRAKVAGKSIDAQLRYNEIAAENKASQCIVPAVDGVSDQPYLSALQVPGANELPLLKRLLVKADCDISTGYRGFGGKLQFRDGRATAHDWTIGVVNGWDIGPHDYKSKEIKIDAAHEGQVEVTINSLSFKITVDRGQLKVENGTIACKF